MYETQLNNLPERRDSPAEHALFCMSCCCCCCWWIRKRSVIDSQPARRPTSTWWCVDLHNIPALAKWLSVSCKCAWYPMPDAMSLSSNEFDTTRGRSLQVAFANSKQPGIHPPRGLSGVPGAARLVQCASPSFLASCSLLNCSIVRQRPFSIQNRHPEEGW